MNVKKRLLDGPRMNRAIRRMAIEILEKNRGTDDLIIVGIRSRGVPIAERMAKEIEEMEGHPVSSGILDITLYRDDLTTIAPAAGREADQASGADRRQDRRARR